MAPEDFQGSRMHKWLQPRYRQGQVFYSGIAKLVHESRTRPYCTPVLFLVIKHYAERFGLVEPAFPTTHNETGGATPRS